MKSYASQRSYPSHKNKEGLPSGMGYILKLAASPEYQWIAAAGKNDSNYIHVIDPTTLKLLSICGENGKAHDSTICDLKGIESSLIASCSRDGTFKIWDVRTSTLPVWSQRISNDKQDAEVNAIDCNNSTIAVGKDSEIALFDLQTRKSHFCYNEMHSAPVTSLKFKPECQNLLVSGSEDSMLCVMDIFDLNNDDEGQSPSLAMNTENGVRDIRVFNDAIFAFSATETISVWNFEGAKLHEMQSLHEHPLITHDGSLGYAIDVFRSPDGSAHVLGGSSSGCLALLDIAERTDSIIATFRSEGVHTEVVRTALLNPSGQIFTGGEDGVLAEWVSQPDWNVTTSNFGPAQLEKKSKMAPY